MGLHALGRAAPVGLQGEGFGELALISEEPRSASILAVRSPTLLITIEKSHYDRVLKAAHEVPWRCDSPLRSAACASVRRGTLDSRGLCSQKELNERVEMLLSLDMFRFWDHRELSHFMMVATNATRQRGSLLVRQVSCPRPPPQRFVLPLALLPLPRIRLPCDTRQRRCAILVLCVGAGGRAGRASAAG